MPTILVLTTPNLNYYNTPSSSALQNLIQWQPPRSSNTVNVPNHLCTNHQLLSVFADWKIDQLTCISYAPTPNFALNIAVNLAGLMFLPETSWWESIPQSDSSMSWSSSDGPMLSLPMACLSSVDEEDILRITICTTVRERSRWRWRWRWLACRPPRDRQQEIRT
jgi:hypothetical protein